MLASHARGRVNVSSAGLTPGAALDPMATQVLADIGIDTSTLFVKPLTGDALLGASTVIALGITLPSQEQAPPGQQRLTWDVTPPDRETYDAAVRDELDRRVLRPLADLLQP